MTVHPQAYSALGADPGLSLYRLLEHEVLADPYPLYDRLRRVDPIHWDAFLHAWVVTRYADVVAVLQRCSAARTPTAEQLSTMGLSALAPVGDVMARQMIFLDPPDHKRIRGLAAKAFTPRRVAALRTRIQEVVDELLDAAAPHGRIDVIGGLAFPLPAILTAEMLGLPASDLDRLKVWTEDFAGILGNFQHDPERVPRVVRCVREMTEYFRGVLDEKRRSPGSDLASAFLEADVEGDRFTIDEVIANLILVMVAGQETTTNLIGNGMLTLLRQPEDLARLVKDESLLPSAIEELLRFESPSQLTARVAAEDMELDGRLIRRGQAIIAAVGAANRDPDRFTDPDRFDLRRPDNRHVGFGWGSHYCFGAAIARLEGQIAIGTMLRRFADFALDTTTPLRWRSNLGLRGLERLTITFRSRS